MASISTRRPGRFPLCLFPTLSSDFQNKHKSYIKAGEVAKKDLEEEKDHILRLLRMLKYEQKTLQRKFMEPMPCSFDGAKGASKSEPASVATVEEYCKTIETFRTLSNHLEYIDSQLGKITDTFHSLACRDYTGYYGLQDWAEQSIRRYEYLCDGIGTAAIFGAGITYTTIFSGTRGNMGLMCWAFALFVVGFIIAICVRSILLWCSRLPTRQKPFASTVPWEFAIRITLITALASTTSAIALLNTTIYLIIIPPEAAEAIQWNIAPAPSAILATTILGGAILVITLCVLLGFWAAKKRSSGPSKRTGVQSADYFAEPLV